MTTGERRPRSHRLAREAERVRCLRTGRRRRSRVLEFFWMDNTAGHPRMGLIVPKFQSNAVARNRLRRRLTELWRRQVQQRQGGRDLLIKARPEAYGATFAELAAELGTFAEGAFPIGNTGPGAAGAGVSQ